jgi:hypothetical protein
VPVVVIGSIIQKSLYELIATPRFKSVEDLKAETLAVQSMLSMELGQLDRVYPMEEFVDKRPLERALERVKGR